MGHRATIFLSCGQRPGEREIAEALEKLIDVELGFNCYNADTRQGFDDVMSITEHLSKADYYLFVDFKREGNLPISVFTHQEFALARAWGITEMLAFREEGLSSYGMLSYILAHPIAFTRDKLLDVVREHIRRRGWSPEYSRNLVVSKIESDPRLLRYTDHHGTDLEHIWKGVVQNRRSDRAAMNVTAILDQVTTVSTKRSCRPDTTFLKWAGQQAYQRTIFPGDSAEIDLFALKAGREGVFLHSARDEYPRTAVVEDRGIHVLKYLLYADTFPPVSFEIEIDYRGAIELGTEVRDPGIGVRLVPGQKSRTSK